MATSRGVWVWSWRGPFIEPRISSRLGFWSVRVLGVGMIVEVPGIGVSSGVERREGLEEERGF